jgi:anti-anti-sigma factor
MVLTIAGSLDAASAVAVDTQYDQLIGTGCAEIVLDVTGVTSVDASGAVALAQLWAHLRAFGVFCRVRGLHPAFADNPLELLLSLGDSSARTFESLASPPPTA